MTNHVAALREVFVQDGWDLMRRAWKEREATLLHKLATHHFDALPELARLQGQLYEVRLLLEAGRDPEDGYWQP